MSSTARLFTLAAIPRIEWQPGQQQEESRVVMDGIARDVNYSMFRRDTVLFRPPYEPFVFSSEIPITVHILSGDDGDTFQDSSWRTNEVGVFLIIYLYVRPEIHRNIVEEARAKSTIQLGLSLVPNQSDDDDDQAVLLSNTDIRFLVGQAVQSSSDLEALRRAVLFDAQLAAHENAPGFLKGIPETSEEPDEWPEDEIRAIKEMIASARHSAITGALDPNRWDNVIEDIISMIKMCRDTLTIEDEQTETRLQRAPRSTRGFSPPLYPSDFEDPGKHNEKIWPISIDLSATSNEYIHNHSDYSGSRAVAWRLARANLYSLLMRESMWAPAASIHATAKRTLLKPVWWAIAAVPAAFLIFINQPIYLCAYLLVCLIFRGRANTATEEPKSLQQYRFLSAALSDLNHSSSPTTVKSALRSIDRATGIVGGSIGQHIYTLYLVRDLLEDMDKFD